MTLNLTISKGITWGPLVITCKDAAGAIVNLAGWSVFAQVRTNLFLPVLFSLNPLITNAAGGQITIAMTDEQTALLPDGDAQYDLVLQNPSGERLGPYLEGTVAVKRVFTRA